MNVHTSAETKLRPCPFCGSRHAEIEMLSWDLHTVICDGCGARGRVLEIPAKSRAISSDLIISRSWNDRPAPSAEDHTKAWCHEQWANSERELRKANAYIRELEGKLRLAQDDGR